MPRLPLHPHPPPLSPSLFPPPKCPTSPPSTRRTTRNRNLPTHPALLLLPRELTLLVFALLPTETVVVLSRACRSLSTLCRLPGSHAHLNFDRSRKLERLVLLHDATPWRDIFMAGAIRQATIDMGGGISVPALLMVLSLIEASAPVLTDLSLHLWLPHTGGALAMHSGLQRPAEVRRDHGDGHSPITFPQLRSVTLRESFPGIDDLSLALASLRQWRLPALEHMSVTRNTQGWLASVADAKTRACVGVWAAHTSHLKTVRVASGRLEGPQVEVAVMGAVWDVIDRAPRLDWLEEIELGHGARLVDYDVIALIHKKSSDDRPPLALRFASLQLTEDVITAIDRLLTASPLPLHIDAQSLDLTRLVDHPLRPSLLPSIRRVLRRLACDAPCVSTLIHSKQ